MNIRTSFFLAVVTLLLLPIALNNFSEYQERNAVDAVALEHTVAGEKALDDKRYLIAEKAFASAVQLRPAQTRSLRGLYRAQASRIINANETLDREGAYRLLYRLENMPSKDPEKKMLYELALANIYAALGDNEAAKQSLDSATKDARANSKAWAMRGSFESKTGALDAAVTSFETALKTDEKNGGARLGLGMVFKRQKKLKQAADQLQRATELLKGPKAWYELGATQLQSGDFESAYRSLSAAANVHPALNSEPSLLFRLGVAAYKTNKFDQAVNYLEAAYKLDQSLDTSLNLGVAYQKVGRHQDATRALAILVKKQPAHGEAHALLMKSLVQLNQADAARKLGRQYLARAQNRPAMQNGAALIKPLLQQLRATFPKQIMKKALPTRGKSPQKIKK